MVRNGRKRLSKRKLRLSGEHRLRVGLDCADLEGQQSLNHARNQLFQQSKFARFLDDELKSLDSSLRTLTEDLNENIKPISDEIKRLVIELRVADSREKKPKASEELKLAHKLAMKKIQFHRTLRREAIAEHARKMSKLTRPNTKRFYRVPLVVNRSVIIKQVAKAWRRHGFQASERTVYRCWREFEEFKRQLKAKNEKL
jgi:exonuclease VII large subunit